MKTAGKDYIINTIYRTNVLPVVSSCNTACIFCSHRQNPPGVETYRLPELTLEDFKELIEYLSPDGKIVIGEAATRIIEGEPLLREDFIDIAALVRKRFPKTAIQVTTNGMLITRELVKKLEDLGNIELNISVNCIHPEKRMKLLGLKTPQDIREKVLMLKDRLSFSGSFVLVPDLLTYEDIEEMVAFLDMSGAAMVRAFLPGYTVRSGKNYNFTAAYFKMQDFVNKLKCKYSIPVVIEPPVMDGLECRVEGVIRNSPAFIGGVKSGDVILTVCGYDVSTRVEAFNMTYNAANPVLFIKRGEEQVVIRLEKPKNSSPGFITLYDADPGVMDTVGRAVERYGAHRVLVVTSMLACGILKKLFSTRDLPYDYCIYAAENLYFGGTIKCAGLLTAGDIVNCVARYVELEGKPDLILLPPVMFDFTKRDLLGVSINEIENKLGIPVDIP
jgi:uncharacterized Fe-S cluster-containing radical SAM superfamily protein